MDRVTADTPVHEVSHPIIIMLKNSTQEAHKRLYSILRDNAISELDSGSALSIRIKNKYSDLSREDLIDETIATKLGFQSVAKVQLMDARITQDNAKGIVAWAKRMMSRVIDFINRIMYGKKSFNLNEYSTYGDVADAMIDSILNGNMDLVFGDMSAENGVGLLNAIAELSADSKPLESL